MARVKRGVTGHAKHKKVFKAAKGYYGRRKNTIRVAKQAVEKANQYAYRDRKRRKRTFRALWIQRLNAAVRPFGFTYSRAERHSELGDAIRSALETPGPTMCEIFIDEAVSFAPKLGAKQHPDGRITSPALEDLSPFLPREVLQANMRIDLADE